MSPHAIIEPIYDSRATHVSFQSAALGVTKSFYVYVPPELEAGKRAPVLFLLRGHEREWLNGQEDTTRGGTNAIDVYERLRAAGTIEPMVLVFPGLSSDDSAVPSVLVNMRQPERAAEHAGIGSGRFADYFYNDLIPFVEAHFPADPSQRRGLVGFSLGGAMAAKAAAERPDLFAAVAAYDGTFLYARDRGRTVRRNDAVIFNPLFDAAFGSPRDFNFIADHSPANLILRAESDVLASITWMIGFGPRSAEPWNANYFRGAHLLRCLQSHAIHNAIRPEELEQRDHTWRTADAFLELTLPVFQRVFRAK